MMKSKKLTWVILVIAVLMFTCGCSEEYDSSEYKEYLANGGDPNIVLLTAIDECDVEMAKAAVVYGVDVNRFSSNISDDIGRSYFSDVPLRVALSRGSKAADIVKLLIDEGADVDYMDDEEYETNLMFCAKDSDVALVDILLQNGADINKVNQNGDTALSVATSNGAQAADLTEQIVRLLLDYNAKVTTKAVNNAYEMESYSDGYIVGYTQYRLVGILMRKADEQGRIKKVKFNKYLKAAFLGDNNILTPYLKNQELFDEENFRVVLACAASNNIDAIRLYLKNNDVDRTDARGTTMLMVAAACGAEAVADLLIDKGANLQKLDSDGRSAAVVAQKFGEYIVFKKIKSAMETFK